jgi:hypothetical protein
MSNAEVYFDQRPTGGILIILSENLPFGVYQNVLGGGTNGVHLCRLTEDPRHSKHRSPAGAWATLDSCISHRSHLHSVEINGSGLMTSFTYASEAGGNNKQAHLAAAPFTLPDLNCKRVLRI